MTVLLGKGPGQRATPTALRGRANPLDVRRRAHAEPWAWHPKCQLNEGAR